MYKKENHIHELYTTPKGSVHQCDLTDKIYLTFKDSVLAFKIQDFLMFRRKVHAVDIHEMIFNLSDKYDFEVIESQQYQFSLKLTLCDIIQLRELLDGARFTIEMYSMLHEVLGDFEIA
ncbi:MAG: hypothetical protein MUF45_07530 [Spirosomaceae bacterium]|jgi:hypothetical protein|nr:hypothetical protein [Spirosomataceae bacterium]